MESAQMYRNQPLENFVNLQVNGGQLPTTINPSDPHLEMLSDSVVFKVCILISAGIARVL